MEQGPVTHSSQTVPDAETPKEADITVEEEAPEEQEIPPSKFVKGQRVYAKDMMSGLLYEAVVRRCMYGTAKQRQLCQHTCMSQQEIQDFYAQEPEPTWHCFVHYLGWNVKWDRWVEEDFLFEPSEGTKELARRLQEEVKEVKAEQRRLGKGKKVGGAKLWVELERRMKRLEEERRIEERREELAKQGIVMEEEAETENKKDKKGRKKLWTKASLTKELELRGRNLQGRRKQSLAEKLVLPFTLKKIVVDEWEYIAHCEMLPNLPVPVSVRGALNQYLESKLDVIGGTDKAEESQSLTSAEAAAAAPQDDVALQAGPEPSSTEAKQKVEPKKAEALEVSGEAFGKAEDLKRPSDAGPPSSGYPDTTAAGSQDLPSEFSQDEELTKKQQEWKDMVEGIAMLFDQSLSKHLLYPNEHTQLELLQQSPETAGLLPSEVYGCEHLLRFFIHLPDLLVGQLSDVETRPIYSKMNDLVRFLQKHQTTLFTQTHHPIKEEERPVDNAVTKKRKGTGRESAKKRRKSAATSEEQNRTSSVDN